MADPLNLFPVFVRNQSWPNTSPGGDTLSVDLDVSLEDAIIGVEVSGTLLTVLLPEEICVCLRSGV